ncbi:MAG: ABC transporter ATP-binding protein [Microbacteriaceae bacterium]|nr:ABC transporter ATP-binding protein [Microbacteriaceae bacterium]
MTNDTARPSAGDPILVMQDVVQEFAVRRRGAGRGAKVSAVANVSIQVARGEALAIVGETGSGKTTLARTILGAPPPKSGRIVVDGHDVSGRRRSAARERGKRVQMIFQDPMSALDPTWSVERIVGEPLTTVGGMDRDARRRRIAEVLDRVGLSASRYGNRRPHELSGGQAQRIAIARALVGRPALVICDEPVTALDASSQAQVVALLAELKREFGLTYLFIAHDLAVVQQLADRVATMYLGKICETAPTEALFSSPTHPYTAALLSAIPSFEPNERPRLRLLGEPPSPISPPSGCRFRTRCAFAQDVCAEVEPKLREVAPGHEVACHFPLTNGRAASYQPAEQAAAAESDAA